MNTDNWVANSLVEYKIKGINPPTSLLTQMIDNAFDALKWLDANQNKIQPFAGNVFNYQQIIQFIKHLYRLGATRVLIGDVYDEDWRLQHEGGPYADILFVLLPDDDIVKKQRILRFLKKTKFKPDELSFETNSTHPAEKWMRLWWD